MAFIPNKMDEAQIAFLANEITKSYMTGKNMGSQEEFVHEYFNMYQQTMKIIAEEERKKNNAVSNLDFGIEEDIEDTLSPNSRAFH